MQRLLQTAFVTFTMLALASFANAAGEKVGDSKTDPDYKVQGEYEGKVNGNKVGFQVVALGKGKFDVVLLKGGLPGAGWDGKTKAKLKGESKDGATLITGSDLSGKIVDGILTATKGDATYEAKHVVRESPTLGKKPPKGAIVLFDGKNVEAWNGGKVVDKNLLNVGVRTKQTFGDYTLHLEFRTPYMPESRGQSRGNSGMYISDQYECQVLDSFGLEGKDNECGGIYSVSRPDVNMCLPPMAWQTYDVEFKAARFDREGKKTKNAVVTIRHNGVVIHGKRELPKPTPGGGRNDEKAGAIFLQNHGDPVRYRNIWIVEDKAE
ncbi:MAG: hypothetical protein CMJ78_21355 [Planctomycetaceae bacterium]|nr:hypothetical protein [Planctomycetaceae bacterium]